LTISANALIIFSHVSVMLDTKNYFLRCQVMPVTKVIIVLTLLG